MGHIHADSEYDYTASAIIVHDNKVLLLFHKKLQMWLPPAGHIELNETPIEALYREIEEETGLIQDHLTLVTPFTENMKLEHDPSRNTLLPMPFNINTHMVNRGGHQHIDFAYILLSDTDVVENEVDKADALKWFTSPEIAKLSPMPRLVHSHAEYALKKTGELQK